MTRRCEEKGDENVYLVSTQLSIKEVHAKENVLGEEIFVLLQNRNFGILLCAL